MTKLVFISSIAAPHQVKSSIEMKNYFNTEYWFYDNIGERAKWWQMELPSHCLILDKVFFKKFGKYLTLDVISQLNRFDPDIVYLGGFSIPSNYIAYLWAKFKKKRTIVFTERSRNKEGILRKKSFTWRVIKYLYRNVDLIITSEEDIVDQFKVTFGFGEKVVGGRYAADIDSYLNHEIRKPSVKVDYSLIFPNRLTKIYNPIFALKVFNRLLLEFPNLELKLNAIGELRSECEDYVLKSRMEKKVSFLDNIQSWEDLSDIYQTSHIMILPATFSNGNFTIIEAMASGMGLVISDNVLGVGNYINNGQNGFRIPLDYEGFYVHIRKLIVDTDLINDFATRNRQLVLPLSIKGTVKFISEIIFTKFENDFLLMK